MAGTPLKIFISYSRTDSPFVDRLEADLKARSFHTWVDRLKLEGGQNWLNEIEKAIDNCHICLIVVSPQSVTSEWVRMEYRYARQQGKPLIPLFHLPTQKVPIDLNGLQWVDFQRSYDRGLADVLIALSRQDYGAMPPMTPHPAPMNISINEPVQNREKLKRDHSARQGLSSFFKRKPGNQPNSLIKNDDAPSGLTAFMWRMGRDV